MRESWEHHSLDSIDLLLRQIRAIQASIEVSRVTLETTGKTNVRCRMADARERGMKGLQNFADALRDATHDAAMKALQEHAAESLSDLSDAPKNGAKQLDSSEQNSTKSKAADKGKPPHKARQ
jgi:hypothetical protein